MKCLICPKCNYRTDNDETFCYKCGTKLTFSQEKTFCKSCGTELKPNEQYCTQCGAGRNKTKRQEKQKQDNYFLPFLVFLPFLAIPLLIGHECGYYYVKKNYNNEKLKKMARAFSGAQAESITDLQQRAKDGDADAQYRLAECYQGRISSSIRGFIPPNRSQAVYWYQKAADQGHEGAKTALKQLGH